ncbi:HSP40/DnaJ peptide-binding protein [Actinidia rufa]|uniref:HSP40/DnaJ peptide-binding protein n=1 Tax=Actinidia rufa TaxID=165716 RepID=A0A7J0FEK4_9ERIC|nr:HSP40/DnaJ peptide-binding protein [Actinidia rufa]
MADHSSASRSSQTLTLGTASGRLSRSPSWGKVDPTRGRSKSRGSLPRSLSQQGSATGTSFPGGSLSRSSSRKGLDPHHVFELEWDCKTSGDREEARVHTRGVVLWMHQEDHDHKRCGNWQRAKEKEKLTTKVKARMEERNKDHIRRHWERDPGTYPSDIIFVVSEKKHPLFRREGEDLKLVMKIPLVKALADCTLSVPLLGVEKMSLEIDEIIRPGFEQVIQGEGMPKLKEHGKRGDLRIEFQVEFPTEMGDEKRADVSRFLRDSC